MYELILCTPSVCKKVLTSCSDAGDVGEDAVLEGGGVCVNRAGSQVQVDGTVRWHEQRVAGKWTLVRARLCWTVN